MRRLCGNSPFAPVHVEKHSAATAASSHPASTLFVHRSSWWDKNKAAAAILADKVKRSVGTLSTTWLIVIDRCSVDKYFAFS